MDERNLVLVLGSAGFVVMADSWVISPLLPAIAYSINVSPVQAGLLVSAYMVPFGLFQLLFGPLADRYGKREVITFSMVFFTIVTGLCGLGRGLYDLALCRAVTGIFAASVMPISFALIGDTIPVERRQKAIAMFMGTSFLGQGLSMALGGCIAYFVSWRGVFLTYAALSLIATVLLVVFGSKALSKKNPHSAFARPYLDLVSNRRSLAVYMVIFAEGVLIVGAFSYLGALADFLFHYNYFVIGLFLTAFGVGALLSGRFIVRLVPSIGRSSAVALGLAIASAAEAVLSMVAGQPILLVTGIALLGIGTMSMHSTLLTVATEFAKEARGTAMCLVTFCFMGGGGLGTAIGGRIIASHGYACFYRVYAIFLVALLIIALAALKGSFTYVAREREGTEGDP